MSSWDKKVLFAKTSYKDYLLNYVKISPDVIPFLQTESYGLYGVGIDAVPAGDLAGLGYPGFAGMDLSGPPGPGLGAEITKQDDERAVYFSFSRWQCFYRASASPLACSSIRIRTHHGRYRYRKTRLRYAG